MQKEETSGANTFPDFNRAELPSQSLPPLKAEPVAVLSGHKGRVWCVSWCPNANLIASASGDRTVNLWSPLPVPSSDGESSTKWSCVGTLSDHTRTVRHVSWSPSGEYLACASFDHTASIYKRSYDDNGALEYQMEAVLDGHESELKCVSWLTESKLATCSRDRSVWVWERIDEGEYECAGVLTGHTQDVKHCLWSLPLVEDEKPLLISCGYDNTIKIWSESLRHDDWHCIQTCTAHEGTVWAASFQKTNALAGQETLPAQPLLCSCSDDLNVLFWLKKADGKFVSVARYSGFAERSIFSVDWAPCGLPLVACGSGDNSITLLGLHLNTETQSPSVTNLCTIPNAHEMDVNSVHFSPFGSLTDPKGLFLASGGDDGVIRIWNITSQSS